MSGHSLAVILAAVIVLFLAHPQASDATAAYTHCSQARNKNGESLYHFTVTTLDCKNISLSKYKGKFLLIVNVATYSSNTWQYLGLSALQSQFERLEILGFPCNQFEYAEPGETEAEILNGLSYVRPGGGFRPNFSMFKKIDVNDQNEHPLYTYLKERCPAIRKEMPHPRYSFDFPYKVTDIRQDFEKFLIDDKGFPLKRYDSDTRPEDIGTEFSVTDLFSKN